MPEGFVRTEKNTDIAIIISPNFFNLCNKLNYDIRSIKHTKIPTKYSKFIIYYYHNDIEIEGRYNYKGELKTTTLSTKKVLCEYLDCKDLYEAFIKYNKGEDYNDYNIDKTPDVSKGYRDTDIHSCMSGEGEFFKYLQDNVEELRYVSFYKEGREYARCMLWLSESVTGLPDDCDGLVDRIYPSDNHRIVDMVKKWASANNYAHRTEQNYRSTKKITYKGEELELQLKVEVGYGIEKAEVPYMDTFKYYKDGILYNFPIKGYIHTLDSTEGDTFIDSGRYCCACGDRINEGDAFYNSDGECFCEYCFHDNYTYCSSCSEYYLTNEITYIENTNEYICDDCMSDNSRYVYSDYHGCFLDYDDGDVFRSEIDDNYYLNRGSLNYSKYSNDYSYNEDIVDVIVDSYNRTETYFECEAEEYAYYCEDNDTWYKSEELYNAIKENEDDED